jgi:histidinol dehydrogenase
MMLVVKNWLDLTDIEQKKCIARAKSSESITPIVQNIIDRVKQGGDKALLEMTETFDKVSLESLEIICNHFDSRAIQSDAKKAIQQAITHLTQYHQALLPENMRVRICPGVDILNAYYPIQRVGLYVPGGNHTPLVSSLLMTAIPAKLAGCPIKVLCTPPDAKGQINPLLVYAAQLCGIQSIYTVGGAQAIAAMAYGTETIVKVDKLFGPGNRFVTEAKCLVASDPCGAAIDMPAGPSEVMISADDLANAAFVAADLLAQAEHGPDSQVILLCDSMQFAMKVNRELEKQYAQLNRQSIIKQSLKIGSIIVCSDLQKQQEIINDYAPEHLIINRQAGSSWVNSIYTAGTIFIGPWAAETLGDYVTGSNHVLPTNGFAKAYSGLSVTDYMRRCSVQQVSQEGIRQLGASAVALASIEGLDAHAAAVEIRLKSMER